MGGITTDVSGRVMGSVLRGDVGEPLDEGTMTGDEGRDGGPGTTMVG